MGEIEKSKWSVRWQMGDTSMREDDGCEDWMSKMGHVGVDGASRKMDPHYCWNGKLKRYVIVLKALVYTEQDSNSVTPWPINATSWRSSYNNNRTVTSQHELKGEQCRTFRQSNDNACSLDLPITPWLKWHCPFCWKWVRTKKTNFSQGCKQ